MSFFHHHHDRANIDVNITENINEGAPGYQQPPWQPQPPYQQQPPPPLPYQQPYGQISETVEVIKQGPFGNVEVDTITERVRPDGTVIVEEVRREGYNSGW